MGGSNLFLATVNGYMVVHIMDDIASISVVALYPFRI